MKLKYTIECIGTSRGPRYRVVLWCGSVAYYSHPDYEFYKDAERAAKVTGASDKDA